MLILLPPSETKRDGGDGAPLDLRALTGDGLVSLRERMLVDVAAFSRDRERALKALHLSAKQAHQLDWNRVLRRAATMPAIERYDGVLYDALDVASLDADARAFLDGAVVVQSALFGPIGAADPIPAYRLSGSTSIGGASLKERWGRAGARALTALAVGHGVVLDLRSKDYAALSAAPAGARWVEVVAEDGAGRRRALNHFNKHGKGALVRRIAETRADPADVPALLDWAAGVGIRLEEDGPDRLTLVV